MSRTSGSHNEDAAAGARRLATEAQRRAADPRVSVALEAAAGSGKTRALVDRYVRLCLAGACPRSLLAVTFTRKAAVEIQDRLLARAARYAHLAEDDLRRELTVLIGQEPSPAELRRAAGLQEALLEDLAGLPIGTIHSFCQSILSRFAAEAGVDPRFSVLERIDQLWEEALERLEREAAADSAEAEAFASLAAKPQEARRLLGRLRADVLYLERWLDRLARARLAAGRPAGGTWSELLPDALRELEGEALAGTPLAEAAASGDASAAGRELLAAALATFAGAGLDGVQAAEGGGSEAFQATMERMAAEALAIAGELRRAVPAGLAAREGGLEALLDRAWNLPMTGSGTLRAVSGKRACAGERKEAFGRAAAPVLEAIGSGRSLLLLRRNATLLRFGLRALDHYRELKRRDRCLDFQDLEHQAWRVVNDPEAGPWVQYRLDQRIDHLLVDEFQDTNDSQWGVLAPIARELLAGRAPDGSPRTVFFVGDPKQSIYGWRGAEPRLFERVAAGLRDHPEARLETLPTNFRSLPAIVESVGELFGRAPLSDHLPGGPGAARQHGDRAEERGEVAILPLLPAEEGGAGADEVAARACAGIVRRLVGEGHTWEPDPVGGPPRRRPLTWDDVLVLCRGRTHIVVYEQALRAAGVPICPAGRGLLARSREVQDILALLRWLSFPEDDAALAAVMRSPILRLPEPMFQEVLEHRRGAEAGAGRRRSLWWAMGALRARPRVGDAVALLSDWLGRVGRDDCHDLLRRIWRTGHLPQRYAAALGEQARFNLDRLLDIALSEDLGRFPTVRRFGELLRRAAAAASEEEATAPPSASGRVRIMTVHAAKGLEAPVVLLVDSARPCREGIERLRLRPDRPDGPLLYGIHKDHWRRIELPAGQIVPPLAAVAEADQRDQLREEADILYVALTRARDRLFVLGGQNGARGERPSFHAWLEQAAAAALGAVGQEPPFVLGRCRWLEAAESEAEESGAGACGSAAGDVDAAILDDPVPVHAWTPPPLRESVRVVSPSAAERGPVPAPVVVDEDGVEREDALLHGKDVHLWLQHAAEAGRMPPGEGEAWGEADAVFRNPDLGWVFHPEREGGSGLCEVPFARRLPAPGAEAPEEHVFGAIDRLVLRPGRADVIDYKTSRTDPDGPSLERLRELREQHREQLRHYRETIGILFPGRAIGAHLLLTHPRAVGGRGILVSLDDEAPAGAEAS